MCMQILLLHFLISSNTQNNNHFFQNMSPDAHHRLTPARDIPAREMVNHRAIPQKIAEILMHAVVPHQRHIRSVLHEKAASNAARFIAQVMHQAAHRSLGPVAALMFDVRRCACLPRMAFTKHEGEYTHCGLPFQRIPHCRPIDLFSDLRNPTYSERPFPWAKHRHIGRTLAASAC